jgi:hypothetical protein
MSTLKTNNVQVGQSVTATNNFTIYQPASPDGTVRIGVGNSGATTGDAVTINSTGIVKGSIVSGTAVASTSGTSIDFTGIPATAKRITVMFSGVSTNGASDYLVQLGDSGGIEATGYIGSSSRVVSAVVSANYTTGFGINNGTQSATYICSGVMTISLLNSSTNLWAESGTFGDSSSANTTLTGGSKALSDVLTQVRITTVGGTNTFDAGTINIMWEG